MSNRRRPATALVVGVIAVSVILVFRQHGDSDEKNVAAGAADNPGLIDRVSNVESANMKLRQELLLAVNKQTEILERIANQGVRPDTKSFYRPMRSNNSIFDDKDMAVVKAMPGRIYDLQIAFDVALSSPALGGNVGGIGLERMCALYLYDKSSAPRDADVPVRVIDLPIGAHLTFPQGITFKEGIAIHIRNLQHGRERNVTLSIGYE